MFNPWKSTDAQASYEYGSVSQLQNSHRFLKTWIIAVHSPVPSPCVVSAPGSHFCLCGVGGESSEARACSCPRCVPVSAPSRPWRWPPLSTWRCRVSCCPWHGLGKGTNGDTGCTSCVEFPAKCWSLLVLQEMGSWHCITYKVDYFYGSLQTGFCKVEQDRFLLWLEALLWVTLNWSLFAAAGWDFICRISLDDEQAETESLCGEVSVYFWQGNTTTSVSLPQHKPVGCEWNSCICTAGFIHCSFPEQQSCLHVHSLLLSVLHKPLLFIRINFLSWLFSFHRGRTAGSKKQAWGWSRRTMTLPMSL